MIHGSILVEWDSQGRLNIKTSLNLNGSDGKKACIEKLLDAARAVNDQGTHLILPPTSSSRVVSASGG